MSFVINKMSSLFSAVNTHSDVTPFSQQLQDTILQDAAHVEGKSLSSLSQEISLPLPNGELPLCFAIRRQARNSVEQLFLNPNIDLNQKDDQGLTALDHLFLTRNPEFQNFVLGLFCKKTTEDVRHLNGGVALSVFLGILKGKVENKTEDPVDLDAYPVHAAAKKGDLSKLSEMYLENDAASCLDQQTPKGFTPLHYAVKAGREDAVSWLLEHGAKVDLQTKDGVSLLHLAAIGKNQAIVNLLTEKKLDPNSLDTDNYTPLYYAILSEDWTVAHCLIKKGANPLFKGVLSASPLEMMVTLAQKRSRERDPLQISLMQKVLCVTTLAVWVQHQYGSEAGSSATSWMFSLINAGHLFDACRQIAAVGNRSKLSHAGLHLVSLTLLSGSVFHGTPILAEVSLILRTYYAGYSVLQGIRAGLRNRHLDRPWAGAKIFVHAVNGAFSVGNLYQRAQSIAQRAWEHYNWQQEAAAHLAANRCEDAVSTAVRTPWFWRRNADDMLGKIAHQCTDPNKSNATDLTAARNAISLMSDQSQQDIGWEKVSRYYLAQNKCDPAEEAASNIKGEKVSDEALVSVVKHPKCLEDPFYYSLSLKKGIKVRHRLIAHMEKLKIALAEGECWEGLAQVTSTASCGEGRSTPFPRWGIESVLHHPVCQEKFPEVIVKASSLLEKYPYNRENALSPWFQQFYNHSQAPLPLQAPSMHVEQKTCEESYKAISLLPERTRERADALTDIMVRCWDDPSGLGIKAWENDLASADVNSHDKAARMFLKQGNCDRAGGAASTMLLDQMPPVVVFDYQQWQAKVGRAIMRNPICLEQKDSLKSVAELVRGAEVDIETKGCTE